MKISGIAPIGMPSTLSRIEAIQQRINDIGTMTGSLTKVVTPRLPHQSFESMLNTAIDDQDKKDTAKNKSRDLNAPYNPHNPPRRLAMSGKAPREILPPSDANGYQAAIDDDPTANGYGPYLDAAAKRNGIDPNLVRAVAATESGYDQSAISPVGAVGIMQLMPSTAAGLGVNPFDAQENIEGGVRYLSNQIKHFGGDIRRAVAAYNAGPGAVEKYDGIPPYRETQDYVSRVMDRYQKNSAR